MRKQKFNKIVLINNLMRHGEKWQSELILLKNLKLLQKKTKKQLKRLIKLSMINSSSFFLLKKIQRKKKNVLEFPFILHKKQKYGIKEISKVNKNLIDELLESANNRGKLVSKKKELYANVFATKKLAHYRWFF